MAYFKWDRTNALYNKTKASLSTCRKFRLIMPRIVYALLTFSVIWGEGHPVRHLNPPLTVPGGRERHLAVQRSLGLVHALIEWLSLHPGCIQSSQAASSASCQRQSYEPTAIASCDHSTAADVEKCQNVPSNFNAILPDFFVGCLKNSSSHHRLCMTYIS